MSMIGRFHEFMIARSNLLDHRSADRSDSIFALVVISRFDLYDSGAYEIGGRPLLFYTFDHLFGIKPFFCFPWLGQFLMRSA